MGVAKAGWGINMIIKARIKGIIIKKTGELSPVATGQEVLHGDSKATYE